MAWRRVVFFSCVGCRRDRPPANQGDGTIKLHFLGGADEVGASCLLIEAAGQRVLVDAGIRVSPKARDGLSGELLPDLAPLSDTRLDAVLVTHAHADHIGALPLVLGSRPDVPVYATPATISLIGVMLQDALRIMETRVDAEGELPSYDPLQVERLQKALRPMQPDHPFFIGGALRVQCFCAGHIPGAVTLYLESAEGSVLVSGDVSFSPMRATPSAEVPRVHPDVLILESTYGGRLHANRRAEEARLVESITRIAEGGGRVLIPAFALGRAQEVALILDAAIAAERMPPLPVYLDGMTRSVTQAFADHPSYLSTSLARKLEADGRFWRTDRVRFVQNRFQREEVARAMVPAVIVASSGMLTGGASPAYAKHIVSEPQSAIFITGYQDEEAPGRILQRLAESGGGQLVIDRRKHDVACKIGTYSLSAHADENELTQFAARLEPQWVYLVHGDAGARQRMAQLLHERNLGAVLPAMAEVAEPRTKKRSFLGTLPERGVGEDQPLSAVLIWEALTKRGLGDSVFRSAEIARFWFGDDLPPGAVDALEKTLGEHCLHFVRDWRDGSCFRIESPKHVAEVGPRLAWLERIGPVTGRCLLMQTAEGRPYVAVGVDVDGYHVSVIGARGGASRCLAERVVIAGDAWPEDIPPVDPAGPKAFGGARETAAASDTSDDAPPHEALAAFQKRIQLAETRLAAEARDALAVAQVAGLIDGAARTLEEVAGTLHLDVADSAGRMRLAWRLLEFRAKSAFGTFTLQARVPRRDSGEEEIDFNRCRELIRQLLPRDAALRKVSADLEKRTITLRFDFPDVAEARYATLVDRAAALTGWSIVVHPSVNQNALRLVAHRLIPKLAGPVAIHLDTRQVEVTTAAAPADWTSIQDAFKTETGFQLVTKGEPATAARVDDAGVIRPRLPREPIEINAAYDALKARLGAKGLYRAGLKGEAIVLSFITPEVGARHASAMQELADETGYPLRLHPYPNQHELASVVDRLCREHGLTLAKLPSLLVDRRTVQIQPIDEPAPETVAEIGRALTDESGYGLEVKTMSAPS
jgi:Cft2 family RNA processing exonuclease